MAERRRRSEKQAAALARRGERGEEMRKQREELEAFAAARSRLNEQRKKMMDAERQAHLDKLAEIEAKRREDREIRVATNQVGSALALDQVASLALALTLTLTLSP